MIKGGTFEELPISKDFRMGWLIFLDWIFMVFHSALILFILFGWIWKPLRIANFMVLSLTFASWGILGIWYGFGYCPLTDWHWNVLYKLGQRDLPISYVQFLIERALRIKISPQMADVLTLGLALSAWIISGVLNLRDKFYLKTP